MYELWLNASEYRTLSVFGWVWRQFARRFHCKGGEANNLACRERRNGISLNTQVT